MKAKFKRVLFVFGMVMAVALTVFVFYLSTKRRTDKDTPTSKNIQTPSIKSQYKGKYPIELTVDKKDLLLPKKLPLINLSDTSLSRNYAFEVASLLGFEGEPFQTMDVEEGSVFFWQNDVSSFFFFPEAKRLKYSSYASYQDATNKQLSDEEITNIAKSFLLNNKFINPEEIELLSVNYLGKSTKHEGFDKTNRANALIFEIIFSPKITKGYEVVLSNPDNPAISVKVLRDGSVWNAQVNKFTFDTKTTTTMLRVYNYEEIVNNLPSSVLVSLSGAQISAYDLTENSIEKIEVNEIRPAYLLESYKSKVITPILLLKGLATVTEISSKLDAILYLPL